MARSTSSSGAANRSNRVNPNAAPVLTQEHPTIIVANLGGGNADVKTGRDNGDNAFADHMAVGQTAVFCGGTRDGKRRKSFAVTHSGYNSDKIFLKDMRGVTFMTIFNGETKGSVTDDDFQICGSNGKTYCTVMELFYF